MAFQVLDIVPGMALTAIMQQVDGRLPLKGAGSPVNTVVAQTAPLFYVDTNTGYLYFCTTTDGVTASSANWAQITLNVVSASDSAAGIVELATSEEVLAATDNTRAITPYAAAGAFAFAGANENINQLLGLTSPLSVDQGGTGETSLAAFINALFPSQTGNAGLGLTNNGSGTLSWADFKSDTIQLVTSSSVSILLNTWHLVTASITSTIPSPLHTGNKIILACSSAAAGSVLTSAGGELFNGYSGPLTLDDPGLVTLEYTGTTNGWWVTNL